MRGLIERDQGRELVVRFHLLLDLLELGELHELLGELIGVHRTERVLAPGLSNRLVHSMAYVGGGALGRAPTRHRLRSRRQELPAGGRSICPKVAALRAIHRHL